jgi:hypothetical protein
VRLCEWRCPFGHLLEPALRSAEHVLSRNHARKIDGFPARRAIIYESYNGFFVPCPALTVRLSN